MIAVSMLRFCRNLSGDFRQVHNENYSMIAVNVLIHKYVHNGAVWQEFVCREELQLLLMFAIVLFNKYTILHFEWN